ncbi:MAG: gluconate 2-dehydrogenase subunit 3 family protein [Flavobacteriaceae bacterium]|nr:gluconate 2-dehydrogenase subunit 3 family protein [Flavobacteriaceae bacterium]
MERRTALKNMGMVFGYAVATPTVLGIVQSCKGKEVVDWTPSFFSKEQGAVLHSLLDILLPKTDTPSATEVNVHLFIDQFANEVLPVEQGEMMKMMFEKFGNALLANAGKESLSDLDEEEISPVFAKYLTKRTQEQEEAHEEAMNQFVEATMAGETATLDDEVACYLFANNLRDITIWGYRSSEYVGEEVLAYLPIPGEYVACGDVNELTGGKAWSL